RRADRRDVGRCEHLLDLHGLVRQRWRDAEVPGWPGFPRTGAARRGDRRPALHPAKSVRATAGAGRRQPGPAGCWHRRGHRRSDRAGRPDGGAGPWRGHRLGRLRRGDHRLHGHRHPAADALGGAGAHHAQRGGFRPARTQADRRPRTARGHLAAPGAGHRGCPRRHPAPAAADRRRGCARDDRAATTAARPRLIEGRRQAPPAKPTGVGGESASAHARSLSRGRARSSSAPRGPPAKGSPMSEQRVITIREMRVYRGPNYYAYDQSVHMVLDIGALEEEPTDTLPGFTEELMALLPGLHDHQCSRGRDGGFVERLLEGTWVGHVAEHVALEIQRAAGHELTRGKTRSTGERGVYNVIYGYLDETVGTLAGKLAVRLVNHLIIPEDDFDFTAELEAFLRTSQRVAFGPSTQAILDEAIVRDIPYQRLNSASLVQLGHGVHQQRIRATMTSITSSLAVDIASDKELTNRLLAAAGLPVPASDVVETEDQAVRVARRIGYP